MRKTNRVTLHALTIAVAVGGLEAAIAQDSSQGNRDTAEAAVVGADPRYKWIAPYDKLRKEINKARIKVLKYVGNGIIFKDDEFKAKLFEYLEGPALAEYTPGCDLAKVFVDAYEQAIQNNLMRAIVDKKIKESPNDEEDSERQEVYKRINDYIESINRIGYNLFRVVEAQTNLSEKDRITLYILLNVNDTFKVPPLRLDGEVKLPDLLEDNLKFPELRLGPPNWGTQGSPSGSGIYHQQPDVKRFNYAAFNRRR